MELSSDHDYAHRRNPGGTVDSICLYCFRTVATVAVIEELRTPETTHRCPIKTEVKSKSSPHTKLTSEPS